MESTLRNMVMVLTAVTLIASAGVGGVYVATKDAIAQAEQKKFTDAIGQVLPEFETLSEAQNLKIDGFDKEMKVYTASSVDKTVGYAVETEAIGYTQEIILLVGFNANLDIQKISVLSHAETPGLGAKITNPEEKFVVQFEGKNPAELKLSVKKDGGDLDIITASTITSRAYALAVQRAYDAVVKLNQQ